MVIARHIGGDNAARYTSLWEAPGIVLSCIMAASSCLGAAACFVGSRDTAVLANITRRGGGNGQSWSCVSLDSAMHGRAAVVVPDNVLFEGGAARMGRARGS
jgi:hypothetical protein